MYILVGRETFIIRMSQFQINIVVVVVVAQLAEQSLLVPEVVGSNPIIFENENIYCWLLKRRKQIKQPGRIILEKTW